MNKENGMRSPIQTCYFMFVRILCSQKCPEIKSSRYRNIHVFYKWIMKTEAACFFVSRKVCNTSHFYALQNPPNRIGINSEPLLKLSILQHSQPKTLCLFFRTCNKGLKQCSSNCLQMERSSFWKVQCDSFGTRPKKMRISQRLFIRF